MTKIFFARATCKKGDGCGAVWEIPEVSCRSPQKCTLSCDEATHGQYFYKDRPLEKSLIEINVGDHLNFRCNTGFDLYFSGTNTRASESECCRYCFNPPSNFNKKGLLGNWGEAPTQMDPQVCECRPRQCRPLTPSLLVQYDIDGGPNRALDRFGASAEANPFIPNFELNTISSTQGYQSWMRLKCKNNDRTLFYNNQGTAWQNLNCGTNPLPCKQVACSDPGKIFKHHCHSLDMIIPADVNGNINSAIPQKMYQNGISQFVWSTETENFELDNNGKRQKIYLEHEMNGLKTNVYPGSRYIVNCNKGHFPFHKFLHAVQSRNWGRLQGTTCTATCNKFGEWESSCDCRCDSLEKTCMAGY